MDYQKKYLNYKKKYLTLKKQLGGHTDGKYIYPSSIKGLLDTKSYISYRHKITQYLSINKDTLCDLWLVIGATNQNYVSNDIVLNDLDRFRWKYDFTITANIENIDIKNNDLITLHYMYTRDMEIYNILNMILKEKFSKIIFDWAVTKFVDLKNLIPKLLSLLQTGGKLFIDTFKYNMNINIILFIEENETFYLFSQSREKINLKDKELIDKYLHYESPFKIKVLLNKNLFDLYQIRKLIQDVDESGYGIPKTIMENHLSLNNKKDLDQKEYVEQVTEDFKEIIDYSKYSINYINDMDLPYPNEPDRPEIYITEYFIIKKL
jgi:hypothetical protein